MINGKDIRIIGILMIISGLIDLYIIIRSPEYFIPIIGTNPPAYLNLTIKLLSPPLHILIGYGFVYLNPWSFNLAVTYAALVLINAFANLYILGFGWIRMVFISFLPPFIIYLYWRKKLFTDTVKLKST